MRKVFREPVVRKRDDEKKFFCVGRGQRLGKEAMKNVLATTWMGEEVMNKVSAAKLNLFDIIWKCRSVAAFVTVIISILKSDTQFVGTFL
jgi:hypothetical protein